MADLRQKRPAMAGSREIGMFVFLVVLFCFPLLMGHKARQSFYGSYNLVLLLRHVGMLSIFAIGETFVIITAGIDLSVGSVIALSGVLCGYGLTEAGLPAGCVIAGVLAVGVLIGLFHGFLVVHVRIQPFVARLGTLCVLRSLGMVLTDSLAIFKYSCSSAGENTINSTPFSRSAASSFANRRAWRFGMSSSISITISIIKSCMSLGSAFHESRLIKKAPSVTMYRCVM